MNTIPPKPPRERKYQHLAENDPFEKVTAFIPKSISKILRHESLQQDLPMSRLLVIAVDNEIEKLNSFKLNLTMPTSEFHANEYADEGVKIYEFLKKFPTGTGVDSLWLFRREIGIKDKELFMLGFRELLNSGMVEEFYPQDARFRYAKDYRYVRIVGMKRTHYKRMTQSGRVPNDNIE